MLWADKEVKEEERELGKYWAQVSMKESTKQWCLLGPRAESQGLRLEGRSVERSMWQHEELGFLHQAYKETPSVSSEMGPDLSGVSGT